MRGENTKLNVRQLARYCLVLAAMVVIYSILFLFLMAYEGKIIHG